MLLTEWQVKIYR